MVGALADLSKYPAPFVDDKGVFNGAIVVGENAATEDVLGAIDIAASLQSEAKKAVSVGGTEVVVEGGEDFDALVLNVAASAVSGTYDETDLTGFLEDAEVEINDTDIDYHDELIVDGSKIMPASSAVEEDFSDEIYLRVNEEAIKYRVVFDEAFDQSLAEDEDIEVEFLGQTLTIIGFSDTGVEMEASLEKSMVEGDEITVGDAVVKLIRVGQDSVIVDVDGQTKVIDKSDANGEKFDDADDFEVIVDSIFYVEGASDNIANLKLISSSDSATAEDGEPAELFGESDEKDEADWLWDIDMSQASIDTGDAYFGLKLNIDRLDLDADAADERVAVALGEEISLPNNYAALEFAALEATSFQDIKIYMDHDGNLDLDDDTNKLENTKAVVFDADGEDVFVIDGAETDMVYVTSAGQVWYADKDVEANASAWVMGTNTFNITIDDENVVVSTPVNLTAPTGWDLADANDVTEAFKLDFGVDQLYFYADLANDHFGNLEDEEAGELIYDAGTNVNIGNEDYTFVTKYGVVIESTDTQFDTGASFMISIPTEQQTATLVLKSMGSSVAAAASGSAYMINSIDVGLGMLDSEATLGSEPMIVIGGPKANMIANELLGYPTDEELMATFSEGKALIKWYEDSQAMLVAGWSAKDTRGASYAVANYDNPDYDFSGTEVEVVVTDLKDLVVTAK